MKRKITLFRKNILLVCFTLLSVHMFAQSSCEVEIKTKDNITARDVSLEGTYYQMTITNKGDSNDVFVLELKNNNKFCSNVDGTSNANNIVLNYSFLDSDNNPITEVSLNTGESFNFLVLVTTPNGASLNNWSCVEIIASSKNCEDYNSSILLQTFAVDPNEGE